MLHFNIINKSKTIVFSICILLSVSLFAQSEKTSDKSTAEKSTIVMTKSELNSLLSTIAEARRSQLKEREDKKRKQELAELRLKYKERSQMETGDDDISNQQIMRELRYMNQKIDNLSGDRDNRGLPSQGRDNSTIIMPSNSNPNPVYQSNDRPTTTIIPANNKKIKELEAKIDSLRNAESNNANARKEISFTDSLQNVKGSLKDLRRQMDSLESKMRPAKKLSKTEASDVNRSYFKEQVYFDNNSETLNANYFPSIQDLTQILLKYPEAKVLLEGWASPVGNANYNKQLSMRRALAVEKAFLRNDIDADRLLTAFRGEDKTSSEQHARRVDMAIILR